MHNNFPSRSTVYEWLTDFTELAVDKTKDYKPNVGDTWVADETMLKVNGRWVWFWDIIDAKTRYLLASHISTTRGTKDARRAIVNVVAEWEGSGKTVRQLIFQIRTCKIEPLE